MHDVIAFLETMGQDASLHHANADALPETMLAFRLTTNGQAAAERDVAAALADAMQARRVAACLLFPVKEDEDDKPEQPDRDDDEVRMELAAIGQR